MYFMIMWKFCFAEHFLCPQMYNISRIRTDKFSGVICDDSEIFVSARDAEFAYKPLHLIPFLFIRTAYY